VCGYFSLFAVARDDEGSPDWPCLDKATSTYIHTAFLLLLVHSLPTHRKREREPLIIR
jgi:hypothetical protein